MLRHGSAVLSAAVVLAGAPAPSAAAADVEARFLVRSLDLGGTTHRYRVYVPAEHDAKRPWPVILHLHGRGQGGADLAHTRGPLGDAVRAEPGRFPFIIAFPQAPAGTHGWYGRTGELAMAALEAASREFHGDPRRTYLSGTSMGGYGAWLLAAQHPGRFAAVVVVSGGIVAPPGYPVPPDIPNIYRSPDPYAAMARSVGKTPVWIVHGDADLRVPVTESRRMAETLRNTGGNVRYIELAGVGHEAWRHAYEDPKLPAWLLSHRLGG